METYTVTLRDGETVHHFEVGEYLHHDEERCKYRIYENGTYVASFQPDGQHYLHVCQNPAGLDDELLYRLAEHIELRIPHSRTKLFNDNVSDD